jgi:hypothetical protein
MIFLAITAPLAGDISDGIKLVEGVGFEPT